MGKALVFDATPLIYIIRASLTEPLKSLSNPKILPSAIFEELTERGPAVRPESHAVRELVEAKTLKLEGGASAAMVERFVRIAAETETGALHKAEAEALAVAKQLNGVAISDDKAARTVAKLVGVDLHGTGYLLGRMFKEGCISKEQAIVKMQEMRRSGWRHSEEDYQRIREYLPTL